MGKLQRRGKRWKTLALAAAFAAGMAAAAYGGEWKQDNTGWYYRNDDGSFQAGGGFTPHTWCQLDYNGVTYIFDPQVEDVIANGRGGAVMYIRFGGTTAQLADKYQFEFIMDDFSKLPEKAGGNNGAAKGNGGGNGSGQTTEVDYDWLKNLDMDNLSDEEWDMLWDYITGG